MKASHDQLIKILSAAKAASKLTEKGYHALLRRDEWSEVDLILVFEPTDIEELLGSIRASIYAGKKLYSRRDGNKKSFITDGPAYFFDPFTIIPWAIGKKRTLPDNLVEWYEKQVNATEAPAPVPAYYSDDLKILIQASEKFWANVDPDEKDTHTKQQVVIDWLIEKGYSDISAKQGATIIRPKWAAKGKY